MLKKPLISVLVPVYKVEKYLVCCVESIINQTYKNLEIILIDDGSPDRCPEVCDKFAAQDSRIRVIHKKNGGSADARNAGLDRASGEYIIFVDGDDFIHPEMIADLYDVVSKEQTEIVMCGFICVGENSVGIEKRQDVSEEYRLSDEVISPNEFWTRYYTRPDVAYVVVWNKLIQSNLYKDVRFKKGKMIDDEFVIHHLISQCKKISCIKENLYYYRKRNDSTMTSEFSISHLDVVEARIERALFFKSRKQQHFAEKSITYALSELLDAKEKIDFSKTDNKARFLELRNNCKRAGRQVVRGHSSGIFKLAYLALLLGDGCYIRLMEIRRKM